MFTNWAIDRGPHFVYFWGPLVQSPLDQNMAAAKRPSDPHLAAMILISLITSSIRSWPQQSLNHWTKKTLYKPPRYTECVSVYGIYLYVFDYLLNLLYCACVSLSIYIYSLGHVPIPNMPAFVYSPTPRRVRRLFLADTSQLKRLKMWKLDQTRMCSSSLMYTL